MSERTPHGFRIGPIEVSALATNARFSAVRVEVHAPRRKRPTRFDVESTPKGQNVLLTLPGHPDYQRLTVILPHGEEVSIAGSDRWGWSVSMRDKNGDWAGSASVDRNGERYTER